MDHDCTSTMPNGPWEAKLDPVYLNLRCQQKLVRVSRNGQCEHPKDQVRYHGNAAAYVCTDCGVDFQTCPPYCTADLHVPGNDPAACECGEQQWNLDHDHDFIDLVDGGCCCCICGVERIDTAGSPNGKTVSLKQLERRDGHPQEQAYRLISDLESSCKSVSSDLARFFSAMITVGHNTVGRTTGEASTACLLPSSHRMLGATAYAHILYAKGKDQAMLQFASSEYVSALLHSLVHDMLLQL